MKPEGLQSGPSGFMIIKGYGVDVLFIAYCAIYIFQAITLGIFLQLMLTPRNCKINFLVWGIYSVSAAAIRLFFINHNELQPLLIVISIFLPILICFLLYKDALWIRLTAPILLHCVTIGADCLCSIVFYLVSPESLKRATEINTTSLVMGIAGETAIVFFYLATFQIWHMVRGRRLIKGYFLTLLLPVGQFCFAIASSQEKMYSVRFNIFFMLGELIGFALDIYWVYELWDRSRREEAEEENRQLHRMMELEHIHYREIESKREVAAKIRHDIKNQILAAENLFDSGNEKQAEILLGQLNEIIEETNEYKYCAIPIINAVLQEKNKECLDRNIRLETNIRLEENLSVKEVFLCSLFSNLLDNAVRAAEEMGPEKRWIRLSAVTSGGFLIIKNQNPSKAPEALRPGHGSGSRILSSIAEEYSGEYHTEYKNGIFTAVVSLGIQDESSDLR